jgi:hypothetical protein
MSSDDSQKVSFLKSVFGHGPINRGGIAVNCPACSKDRPEKKKLIIRIRDGTHHCWVCDLKGKTLKYTIKKFHPKRHAEYNGLYGDLQNQQAAEPEEFPMPSIPSGFKLLAQNYHSRDPDLRDTVSYAKGRKITLKDSWRFKLGSCTTGRFKRRLIIPSFDCEGTLNYFVARSIDGKWPKYINAKYPKRDFIFNELYLNWKKPITLVEGPFDLFKSGENSTCILGSSLNERYMLFQKIIQNKTPVLLALDADAEDKTMKIAENLYQYGVDIRVVNCHGYEDVGEMSKKEFSIRKTVAKSWDPQDKLVHLISKIRSGSMI